MDAAVGECNRAVASSTAKPVQLCLPCAGRVMLTPAHFAVCCCRDEALRPHTRLSNDPGQHTGLRPYACQLRGLSCLWRCPRWPSACVVQPPACPGCSSPSFHQTGVLHTSCRLNLCLGCSSCWHLMHARVPVVQPGAQRNRRRCERLWSTIAQLGCRLTSCSMPLCSGICQHTARGHAFADHKGGCAR